MKKILLLVLLFSSVNLFSAAFTPNNIVVVRIGAGVGALSNASTAVFLDEYTTAGVLVQTIAMPTSVSGLDFAFTNSGTATSEGQITLSTNLQYLILTGYNAAPGVASIAGTTSVANPRVVARVDASGVINTTTGITDAFSANNIRTGTSVDGTAFWTGGGNSGVRYVTLGSSTTTQLNTAPTNIRSLNIFNGQLYGVSSSNPYFSVYTVGTGIPTTNGQTTTVLTGLPSVSGPSAYTYALSPAGDVLYICDDRAVASGGGVQKWTLSGGTWSLAYTHIAGLGTSGPRSLTVNWLTANPTLIVTTNVSAANSIAVTEDAGMASTFTTVATAGVNTVFRGISFTPNSVVPVELSSFTSSVNKQNVILNWSTVQEENNKGFEIERSSASTEWKSVGFVNGKGTTNNSQNYSFSDNNLSTGNYSYRIKQIDYNGNYKYYTLQNEVIIGVPNEFALMQNYPNPFNPVSTINYSIAVNSFVSLKVYDLTGKVAASLVNEMKSAGYYSVTFDAKNLSSGTYFYKLTTDKFSDIKRMVVVK